MRLRGEVRCTRVTAQGKGAVCGQSSPVVSLWRGFTVAGALRWLLRETQRLPALRGSSQRAAAPATLFGPPGRPCRKESQTFSLIPFRILWIASAVGCQSTHARLRSPRLLQGNQPTCLQKPLEPETTAGQPAPVSTKVPEPETTAGQTAPVSTKAPGTRDYCRAIGPRVCKSSLTCPLRATGPQVWNRTLPETAAGQPAPASTKAAQTLDLLGQPVPQQSRSPRLLK